MKLFTYTRGKVPVYRLYSAAKSIRMKATKLNGIKSGFCIQANKDDKLYWSWDDEEIKDLGRKIWKDTANQTGRDKHFAKLRELSQHAILAAKEVMKEDFSKLSDKELIARHKQFFNDYCDAHALLDTVIDAVDILPVELINAMIEKELSGLDKKDLLDVVSKVTTPIYSSYISNQELMMLNLILRKSVDVKGVIEKYWWTSLGWENTKLKSTEDYVKDLEHYKEIIEDIPTRIKEIREHNNKLTKQREELTKKYKLSKDVVYRLEFFDKYADLHDLRKEMQMKVLFSDNIFLQEFCSRMGLSVTQLGWYKHEEIHDFLLSKSKFNTHHLKERKKCYFMSNDSEMLFGSEAAQKIEECYKVDLENVNEIRGVCSSPGFAKGKVKVCNGYQDLDKIEIGDILVTGMTLPDYVPAMRKAAAIITDEGGITCHAAIVSRELGTPCVTGTKIATSVLNDNEIVEVDADSGVVRKV
jgi:phosphohistidine swiveling domain-containing protein